MTAFKMSLAALAATAVMALGAGQVQAQDMTQDQTLDQEIKIECETGAYGQTTTCTAEANQRGEQRQSILGVNPVVILENGRVIRPHMMVDTGLNTSLVLGASVLALAMAAAAFQISRK